MEDETLSIFALHKIFQEIEIFPSLGITVKLWPDLFTDWHKDCGLKIDHLHFVCVCEIAYILRIKEIEL